MLYDATLHLNDLPTCKYFEEKLAEDEYYPSWATIYMQVGPKNIWRSKLMRFIKKYGLFCPKALRKER